MIPIPCYAAREPGIGETLRAGGTTPLKPKQGLNGPPVLEEIRLNPN